MSQLPTIISEPESADADTQDGEDGGEKEAETYENVFEYLTKGCYTHRVHQKLKRAFLEECLRSSKLWMGSSITMEKRESWGR